MNFPPTITRASAGTGKTFALSNRYLALVQHAAPPERILATTFARKAAGEILDRILLRLAEAVDDDAKRAELGQFLSEPQLTRGRCQQLLRQLAANLHRLRVGTIDSFFAQIARSFALELGLPPSWRIVEEAEDEGLRDEAIEAVLAAHDHSDLLALVHLLTQGEAQRSVAKLMRGTVDNLYEIYRDATPEAWEQLPRYQPLPLEELEQAIEDLRTLPANSKSIQNGRDQDYESASVGDWKAFLRKGIAPCVVIGKTTYNRQPIEPAAVAVYERLIEHAKSELLGSAANFTIGAKKLLTHYDEQYRRVKHARRVMRFDDITQAVGVVAAQTDAAAVAFRLDAHLDHLLLDEFQDTSPAQWKAIRPFAERVVNHSRAGQETYPTGGSFYCVGDVKQAIYGWRGGVAEIFNTVAAQLGIRDGDPLTKSFRSSPVIIDTVNQVFTRLTQHPNLGRAEGAVTAFEKQFPQHETDKTKYNGYACLVTAPADEDDQEAKTWEYAAEYIRDLVQQSPARSIGVLCRTNKAIAAIIYQLRALGIHASEEGGNPLIDSAAVQTVLALLQLADHPGDSIARFHLAHSPLATPLELTSPADVPAALRISARIRRMLIDDGYGPTMVQCTQWLAPACNRRELARLKQLVELAYGYQPAATLRPRDFIRLVRTQRVADPTAHQVRVMTIHGAKGLEFDVVVLPELDKRILGQTEEFVVHRRDGTGPIDCVFKYVPQELQPLLPERFQQMIAAAADREATESMCVLYVALTRAIHALHMIVRPTKENQQKPEATWAGLLLHALAGGKPATAATTLWQHGDPRWFKNAGGEDKRRATVSKTPENSGETPLAVRVASAAASARRSLDRVAPSRLHAFKTLSLEKVFADAENTYARDRGSVMHACFEQVEWLDDGLPERVALRRIAREHAGAKVSIDPALDDFFAIVKQLHVQRALSRAAYASPLSLPLSPAVLARLDRKTLTPRVRREHEFALIQDGLLVTGSIDRLVLLYDGDTPVAADIIDFKTDAMILGAADRHCEQLLAYRDAAARLFQLSPDRIAARLLMVKDGTIVNIT